jgi:hypothetical protein
MDPHTLNRLNISRRGWQLDQPRLWTWQGRSGSASVAGDPDGAEWRVVSPGGDVAARGIVPWLDMDWRCWHSVQSAMLYAEMELAHLHGSPLWDGDAA